MKRLGCANGWEYDSDEQRVERRRLIDSCKAAGHVPMDEAPLAHRSGLHHVTCELCGYSYTYDTSD